MLGGIAYGRNKEISNHTGQPVMQRLWHLCRFLSESVFTRDDDGKPVISDDMVCIGCKMCELRCPDFAIRVTGGI